jgi:hypothetical protein
MANNTSTIHPWVGSQSVSIGSGTTNVYTGYSGGLTGWSNGNITAKDIILDGTPLSKTLTDIQERLCILVPDPKLLEKYTALQDLYSQYKMMEALLKDDNLPKAE